ncbi:transcription termination factor Rho [Sanguibacter sp. HDW7]|uniref:transcription termination factor Rho n=1 Tax=Sanguibacter sp. HDW7 TaxID=2714931 RepID=UPI001F0FBD77
MRLAELQTVASGLGVKGTSKMRKSDLVEAIKGARGAAASKPRTEKAAQAEKPATARSAEKPAAEKAAAEKPAAEKAAGTPDREERAERPAREDRARREDGRRPARGERPRRGDDAEQRAEEARKRAEARSGQRRDEQGAGEETPRAAREVVAADLASIERGLERGQRRRAGRDQGPAEGQDKNQGQGQQSRQSRQSQQGQQGQQGQPQNQQGGQGQRPAGQPQAGQPQQEQGFEDDERGGRRRRGRDRYRERDRKRGRSRTGNLDLDAEDFEIHEDDVLVPIAGILDIRDNMAFVRTSGYLPGPSDVYVSMGQVKKSGLRRGDAITGAVRQPHEGDQGPQSNIARAKANALVRLDTVNGDVPSKAHERPDFAKLTPLYPQERLRLENPAATKLTPRVIDIVAPIGKGQRGLIVAPPKAGKTIIMQQIANSITANNPEVHLMVVLVDERPEEVTDMERTVDGEVIASTFDRPATDHTMVAELAIERAKRLVELGQDVVVLLDSLTRLSRAYNLAAPASGRILSGGVDASALYPPKRFFGAARNIENGGSLTILASALVETGSKMDEVIFEEFKGTGNMELRLSRSLADKRIFPAVDVNASGTRREEILMGGDELKIVWKLRRLLSGLDQQQAIELLLGKFKETKSNVEFLLQVQKTTPTTAHDDDAGKTV